MARFAIGISASETSETIERRERSRTAVARAPTRDRGARAIRRTRRRDAELPRSRARGRARGALGAGVRAPDGEGARVDGADARVVGARWIGAAAHDDARRVRWGRARAVEVRAGEEERGEVVRDAEEHAGVAGEGTRGRVPVGTDRRR